MNTELLKKKILQLAMQGKLVEQEESDGTADELIDQILEEKKKLMSEGKIKKEKLSRIYKNPTDNHYYEKFDDGKEKLVKTSLVLPNGWNYIKMNDVVFYEQPSKYIVESTEYDDKYTTPVLTPGKSFILGYTKETKGVFTNIPTIIFDDFTTESKYVDFVFKVKSSAMKILNCSNLINIKFIYYLLQVINIDTTTHKRHWLSNYEYMIIPIPCKKIQDKIVNRIESLFDRVNEIDDHYNRIDRLKSVLKSKIIDLAIKGELTKQLSTDEPSSKLIENIIEEKHKLMAEGKIKKENLSIIYKDADNQFYEKFDDGKIVNITKELPFKIPTGWSWSRLRNIGIYKKGPFGSSLIKDMFVPKSNNTIKVYEQKNAINKDYTLGNYYITKQYFEQAMRGFEVEPGDIIVSCAGTIGETYILPSDIEKGIINQALMKMKIFNNINIDFFLMYFDQILKKESIKNGKGTAMKNIPPFAVFKEYLIPIPSQEEQERIIEKKISIFNYIKTAE